MAQNPPVARRQPAVPVQAPAANPVQGLETEEQAADFNGASNVVNGAPAPVPQSCDNIVDSKVDPEQVHVGGH